MPRSVSEQVLSKEIYRIAAQVVSGKPQAVFVSDHRGVDKSSLFRCISNAAGRDLGLLSLYVGLSAARTLEDVAQATIRAVFESKIRTEEGEIDASVVAQGYLGYLRRIWELAEERHQGLFVFFDDIGKIAENGDFAIFLKGMVDRNALQDHPLPLLLLILGTEAQRTKLVAHHRPVDRVFEILDIDPQARVLD